MNAHCQDRERMLRQGDSAELDALAQHAEQCPECAREMRIWNEISLAARDMQKSWESPALWPRIREALILEGQAEEAHPWRGSFTWLWQGARFHWQATAAALALVAATALGTWMMVRRHVEITAGNASPNTVLTPVAQKRLLTEQALREVEAAEQAYVKSIDKLSALAEPKLEHASSPLMVSYREKLMVLDAAIAECKADEENNPLNAHLQQELVSMYQEKQRTLEAVVREN